MAPHAEHLPVPMFVAGPAALAWGEGTGALQAAETQGFGSV